MGLLLTPNAKQRFFDSNGDPLVGGKLYTYAAGTTTPITTYTSLGGAANTNPIILDGNGECNVWITEGLSYKFVLADSNDVVQWTVDNIALLSAEADSVVTKTTTYTATVNDDIIIAQTASAWTLSLFPASGNPGKLLRIIKTSADTNELTIDPNGSETINGAATIKLKYQYEEITLICDGSNWNIHTIIKNATTQYLTSGSSSTYTTPLGAVRLRVTVIGAGAGGGGASATGASQTSAGGGGGGGATCVKTFFRPSATYTYSVGAGGTGSSGAGGNTGGTSSFDTMSAAGGAGGVNGSASSGATFGGGGGAGGSASNGDLNIPGGSGGQAVYQGTNAVSMSGYGGGSLMGFGGIQRTPTNGGDSGKGYGGGGSGACLGQGAAAGSGGQGANGIIIVEEFYS